MQRLQKELIDNSGMPILSAVEFRSSIKIIRYKTCSPWRTGFCF
jgi:hypothetical protein